MEHTFTLLCTSISIISLVERRVFIVGVRTVTLRPFVARNGAKLTSVRPFAVVPAGLFCCMAVMAVVFAVFLGESSFKQRRHGSRIANSRRNFSCNEILDQIDNTHWLMKLGFETWIMPFDSVKRDNFEWFGTIWDNFLKHFGKFWTIWEILEQFGTFLEF